VVVVGWLRSPGGGVASWFFFGVLGPPLPWPWACRRLGARGKKEEFVLPLARERSVKPEDEAEVAAHNLTHLPFAAWCPHCVSTRSREGPYKLSEAKTTSSANASKPTFSFDFMFTATSISEEPAAISLVAVDNWTKYILVTPVKRKGGADSVRHSAEAICHMSTQLGYSSINLKADNETTCQAVKKAVQKMRGAMGVSATLVDAHPYSSQSNGAAERAIQTARRQANTLMDELRHRTKLALPHEHPSFRHAA
jgi:hypothetical protein